ncbi:MAG: single-stranded DNA-binding protein [Prochloraceae cyanobacterium]|nr:single-stranded DNA-binding protein [Prochloraceae cyanobacterium]
MNSCILMVKIISDPELRHVQQDGGDPIAVTRTIVEFESAQPEQPTGTLTVVGWRDMAETIKEDYRKGDRAIVQGRLAMNVSERQGVKEKKAELVASRIYTISDRNDEDFNYEEPSIPTSSNNNVVVMDSYKSTNSRQSETTTQGNNNQTDDHLDDIPFAKPASFKNNYLNLQDDWELAANRPGCWLRGTRDIWLE